MTPEESKLLNDLADKVAKTPAPARDPEAEAFIRSRIGNRPDALYIMTQTVIVQGLAIEHAQQEIEQLKQRLAQQAQAPPAQPSSVGGTGFLPPRGSGWQTPQAPVPQQPTPGPGYSYPPPPPSGPFGGIGIGGGGMGSFLKTAGYTAAGVAAGALAFEGVKSMFGGVEHLMGFGNEPQYRGGGFLNDPPRETVINNYYEGPQETGFLDREAAPDLGPDSSATYGDTDVSPDDSSGGGYSDDSSGDDQV